MPNHTWNTMIALGEEAEITRCFEFIQGNISKPNYEQWIDFEKIIPQPKEIKEDIKVIEVGSGNPPIIGMGDKLYRWCCKNWGTKWNAYDCEKHGNNKIAFLTAWAEPQPIYKKLSELFPSLNFEFIYLYEDNPNIENVVQYKAGELLSEKENWVRDEDEKAEIMAIMEAKNISRDEAEYFFDEHSETESIAFYQDHDIEDFIDGYLGFGWDSNGYKIPCWVAREIIANHVPKDVLAKALKENGFTETSNGTIFLEEM